MVRPGGVLLQQGEQNNVALSMQQGAMMMSICASRPVWYPVRLHPLCQQQLLQQQRGRYRTFCLERATNKLCLCCWAAQVHTLKAYCVKAHMPCCHLGLRQDAASGQAAQPG